MECAYISVGIDEEAELLNRKKVKAKRIHTCCECEEPIYPERRYWIEVTKFDGTIALFKTCLTCMDVRDHLFYDFYYESLWEAFKDFVYNYPNEIPWAKIGRLTRISRDKVCDIIEKIWDEEDSCSQ